MADATSASAFRSVTEVPAADVLIDGESRHYHVWSKNADTAEYIFRRLVSGRDRPRDYVRSFDEEDKGSHLAYDVKRQAWWSWSVVLPILDEMILYEILT